MAQSRLIAAVLCPEVLVSNHERGQKMRKQSKIEGAGLSALAAPLAMWLVFYGLLTVHGLTTSDTQRLAKAWTVQDNDEGAPGAARAVRESLALSAKRNAN
jgi:hypothetical protein